MIIVSLHQTGSIHLGRGILLENLKTGSGHCWLLTMFVCAVLGRVEGWH